ncbi:MAG: ATP-binding protein [Planctomycetota bacterium]
MIRRIEALNYRCLRYTSQPLDDFHVLVGPNASGKTTFLDVVGFLGDLVAVGLFEAVFARTRTFQDLIWQRSGDWFELAVELEIPEERKRLLPNGKYRYVRYEVRIGLDEKTSEISILGEKILLRGCSEKATGQIQRMLFPKEPEAPNTLGISPKERHTKTIVNKIHGGNDNFHGETGKGWQHAFKLGPQKSALANLPEDESKFPVGTWLKNILITGVERLVLNSTVMRKSSPPGQPVWFLPDGSNLPWVVEGLKRSREDLFTAWIQHLKTALPDLEDVRTVSVEEDKHRYIVVRYGDGLEVPSWTLSDGTLRLLALTLPAYLPELRGVYMIEEPENGIHPRAVETMYQSLSSVYGAQILMATHSPVILSLAKPSQVLCFSKTESGATDIVRGSEHPALRDWKGEVNLGVLLAGGVLG